MTDLILSQNTTTITMSSLEMVYYINSQRKEGEAELRHDNFMAKVPKVLGESLAPKFLGTSFYVNGAGNKVPRDIYTFPKREACLMAMSYSYDLQAKVFDKMTALEGQQPQLPATYLDALKALVTATEKNLELESQNATLLPKAELCDELLVDNETTYLIDTVAGMAPMDTNQLRNILKDDGWLKFSDGAWLPTAHVRHKAWMVVRLDSVNGTKFPCAAFTMEGISQLRHTQALSDLFKHVPIGQEIFRNGKIKVLQHEHKVVH